MITTNTLRWIFYIFLYIMCLLKCRFILSFNQFSNFTPPRTKLEYCLLLFLRKSFKQEYFTSHTLDFLLFSPFKSYYPFRETLYVTVRSKCNKDPIVKRRLRRITLAVYRGRCSTIRISERAVEGFAVGSIIAFFSSRLESSRGLAYHPCL